MRLVAKISDQPLRMIAMAVEKEYFPSPRKRIGIFLLMILSNACIGGSAAFSIRE